MFLAVSAGALVALFRNTRLALSPVWGKQTRFVLSVSWPGPKWPGLALVAAFFLCALWPIVMPGANVGNFHIYPRDFFLFYFMLVLTVITSIELNREPGEV